MVIKMMKLAFLLHIKTIQIFCVACVCSSDNLLPYIFNISKIYNPYSLSNKWFCDDKGGETCISNLWKAKMNFIFDPRTSNNSLLHSCNVSKLYVACSVCNKWLCGIYRCKMCIFIPRVFVLCFVHVILK